MNQFLEAVGIALNAIWTNKLRSFLTVLGNIVAVTSIIAVVSLIQGMNAYVTDAIVIGRRRRQLHDPAHAGRPQRRRRRARPEQPADHASPDGDAVRKFSENINAVAAQANSSARVAYGDEALDSVQVQGVSRDYIYFSTFNVERGRLINPIGNRSQPPADACSGGRRRIACSDRPIRSTRSSRSAASTSASSASARRRDRCSASRRTSSRSSRSASSRRCSARGSACSCWSSRSRPTS